MVYGIVLPTLHYSHRMMMMMMMVMMMLDISPEYGQTYGTNVPPSVGSWNDQLCFHRWPELRPSSSRPSPRPRWSVGPCGALNTRRWAALRATVMKPVTFKQQETWEIYGKSLWEMGNLWKIDGTSIDISYNYD